MPAPVRCPRQAPRVPPSRWRGLILDPMTSFRMSQILEDSVTNYQMGKFQSPKNKKKKHNFRGFIFCWPKLIQIVNV